MRVICLKRRWFSRRFHLPNDFLSDLTVSINNFHNRLCLFVHIRSVSPILHRGKVSASMLAAIYAIMLRRNLSNSIFLKPLTLPLEHELIKIDATIFNLSNKHFTGLESGPVMFFLNSFDLLKITHSLFLLLCAARSLKA